MLADTTFIIYFFISLSLVIHDLLYFIGEYMCLKIRVFSKVANETYMTDNYKLNIHTRYALGVIVLRRLFFIYS